MSLNIKGKLLDKQLPIQHRFFNILTMFYVIIGGIGYGVCMALEASVFVKIGVLIFAFLSLLFCIAANLTRKFDLWATLLYILMNGILMPVSFFSMGGRELGLDVWIVASIIMGVLILSGKTMYFLLGMDVVIYLTMFLVANYHPEWIADIPGEGVALAITGGSVGIGALGISLLLLYQREQYEQQLHLNAVHRNELERLVNELQSAKEEAEKANNAKTQFLINMSQELQTPLNTILSINDVLSGKDDEEIREWAANIYTAGNIMSSLMGDMVDLSRIESGDFIMEEDSYSLRKLIRETYAITKTGADKKALRFVLEVDENLPNVLCGDANRIRQVILNILSNAVQYTPVGEICYSLSFNQLSKDSIELKVAVKDTGIGIKEEEMKSIFHKFNSEEKPLDTMFRGAGLGLTVTSLILKLMGSRLEVDSEYGQGSTFSFTLLQRVDDWEPVGGLEKILKTQYAPIRKARENILAPNARVLAVDDNSLNLAVINGLLRSTKMTVDTAASGEECLKAVWENQYDLIFMDHIMPDMDGVETLQRIRSMGDETNANVPVIVVTTSGAKDVKDFYLKQGFTDYISKPIQVNALFTILNEYLPEELIVAGDGYEEQIAANVQEIKEVLEEEQKNG